MFSKKEGFKYETEVSKLINEATNNLNQRIISLEIQNQQLLINNQRLEGELVQLKNSIYNDVYILEKRITDFTDIWHPIMTENLNRIKLDLEKTIIETEKKDIKNIQEELENKLINIIEDNNYTNEQVLIGYDNKGNGQTIIPIFIPKKFNEKYCSKIGNHLGIFSAMTYHIKLDYNFEFIIESLEILSKHNKLYFDLHNIININIIDNCKNIIRKSNNQIGVDFNDKSLKVIKKYCDKYNIKIYNNGSEYYNGILVSTLIDQIID